MPFLHPFLVGRFGSPTNIDHKAGTLLLTSLEDLDVDIVCFLFGFVWQWLGSGFFWGKQIIGPFEHTETSFCRESLDFHPKRRLNNRPLTKTYLPLRVSHV